MKKIILAVLSCFILVGCTKSENNVVSKVEEKINNLNNYHLIGDLQITNEEEKYDYTVDVTYKKGDFYRVSLINKENTHEQIILKNEEGVYIVTPSLNKSFKFQSEWPSNSSQSYILDALLKDISSDAERNIKENNGNYEITTKVNYPNNADLTSQTITIDKNFLPSKIVVKNASGLTSILMKITKIDTKTKFEKNYFSLNSNIKEEKIEEKTEEGKIDEEGSTLEERKGSTDENVSSILDDIVYPMYLPSGTTYSGEEVVTTSTSERVILSYTGVKPFILIEEVAAKSDTHETTQVNGDFVMYKNVLGLITDTSLNWNSDGKEYYLIGDTLSQAELLQIASSTATVALTK